MGSNDNANKILDDPEAPDSTPDEQQTVSDIVPKSTESISISSHSLESLIPEAHKEIFEAVRLYAHDMNQAFTIFSGGIQLLRAKAQEKEPDKDSIELIRVSYEKIQRLTGSFCKHLLEVIEPQTEKKEDEDNEPPVNISDLLQTNIIARKYLFTNVISFKTNIPENINVCGNIEDIDRILDNIFSNAILAIKGLGDKSGTITVTVTVDNKYAFIIISDNGAGIPPESQPYTFAKGFSTKQSDEEHGLGLYYSREKAEAIRGTLDLHDKATISEHFEDASENGALAILKLKLAK